MIVNVIEPSIAFMPGMLAEMAEFIERCGRVCYKSEDRITKGSADKFVRMICRNHHESVLEHQSMTAIVTCSRACSHQLVRHRIGAYSQESQRYVNYAKRGYQVICPPSIGVPAGEYELEPDGDGSLFLFNSDLKGEQRFWILDIATSFWAYERQIKNGMKPEDARYILPNACKTELAVTYNLRTWRHVIRERALNKHAQWEIRGIMQKAYEILKFNIPEVFGDLEDESTV